MMYLFKPGNRPYLPKYLLGFCCLFLLTGLLALESRAAERDDRFLAGYATAVLERNFQLSAASLEVNNGVITIRARDLEGVEKERIIAALAELPGVTRVEIIEGAPPRTTAPEEAVEVEAAASEVFPRGQLFESLLADPRWPHFAASYVNYMGDEELDSVAATSFGETIGFYRSTAPFGGHWQLSLQAAVFAIFDLDSDSFDLINADYWVGLPISFRWGDFSALLRVFHQSSHLGDEFLLRSRIDRVNLSYESMDAKISLDATDWLRLYAGGGYIFHKEPEDLEPWSAQVGIEYECPNAFAGGVIRPVAAVDFQTWEERDWDTNFSTRAGIQLENPTKIGDRLLLLLEYFNGHSPNGQFYERSIEYLGLGAHFFF